MSDSENDPGDFDPAEAGSELKDPNEQTNDSLPDASPDPNYNPDNDTMSQQQDRPTPNGEQNDRITAQKPAEAINGFGGLYPRMTGQTMATVLSTRNIDASNSDKDDPSAYRVDISTLECWGPSGDKCPDNEYNKNGQPVEGYMGAKVCDHIAAAIFQAPEKPDLGLKTIDGMIDMLDMTRDAAQSAEDVASSLRASRTEHAQQTAASANAPSDSELEDREPEGQQSHEQSVSPSDAREKLQEAFDDATDGMDTQVHDGVVWINKTPDAPDWTFDAFLKGADQVNYEPDRDSPGQYWKNYVEPSDVDEYISEVLS